MLKQTIPPSNFLKVVFHKIYLAHSWIICFSYPLKTFSQLIFRWNSQFTVWIMLGESALKGILIIWFLLILIFYTLESFFSFLILFHASLEIHVEFCRFRLLSPRNYIVTLITVNKFHTKQQVDPILLCK